MPLLKNSFKIRLSSCNSRQELILVGDSILSLSSRHIFFPLFGGISVCTFNHNNLFLEIGSGKEIPKLECKVVSGWCQDQITTSSRTIIEVEHLELKQFTNG